jgi:hypothetical protein
MAATIADLGARALRRLGVAAVAASDRPAAGATVPAATIATRALIWLAVIAADETPAAADQALAADKVAAIHDALVSQGIASWALDAIPLAVSEEMVRLTAMHLAPAFGKATDPAQQDAIEARIRRVSLLLNAQDFAEQAVMDVHANLDARGKTRWSMWDIPDFAEAPYILMAANLLAPLFGLPADPAADARAMRDLAQVIALGAGPEPIRAEYF